MKMFAILWCLIKMFIPYECDQYQRFHKALFIIYSDLECLIGKIDECKNNPQNSSTTKVCEHIPAVFSMSTISSF